MKTILKQRTFTWMSLLMMSLSINAVQATTLPQATEQKINDITQMLHDNPQVIDNLHESLQRYIQQQNQFGAVLKQNNDYIYHNPNQPSYGAKEPKLTIAFFTDYSCPWCKKLDPVLHELVAKYPQLKVVDILIPLKEMNSSVNSATFALNIWQNKPEAFAQTSQFLIKKPGSHDARSLLQVAKKTDTVALLDEQEDIQKQVNKNYQLFAQLGLQGTPALLIDGEIIPGYLPIEKLEPIIKAKLEQ
ncbi:MAG: DsbA family protein [Vibrio hibernica]